MIRFLIAPLGFVAVIALSARPPRETFVGSAMALPRPVLLKILGRSHLQLVTDYYWLRAINRSTTAKTVDDGLALLALGDLATDLDPRLLHAYLLVGLNAPVPPKDPKTEVWPNSEHASALLEKGVRVFPLDNRLHIILAWNLMSMQHQWRRAGELLMARARRPGALSHFAPLATRLLAASGEFDTSRQFAQAMLDSAETDEDRQLFEQRIKLIDLEEQLSKVDAAAKKYLADHAANPFTVDELLEGGYLAEPPVDPFGGLIILRQGRAHSTVAKRLEVRD